LNGDIRAFDKDIINLAELPIEERIVAVELMCNPTKKAEENEAEIDLANKTEKEECVTISNIEDNVLGSMQGCVDTFISTYNNFYMRFPKLREEAYYRKQSLEILKNLKKYIEKVEGELK
jgi:hypothetical protein